MKRLVKFLLLVVAVSLGAHMLGERVRQRFVGDSTPDDDEFRLAGIFGGEDASSQASALRSVGVRVVLGGVSLDLSDATLDSDGAVVDVDLLMGGMALTVSADWRVDVESSVAAGEVASDVTDPETLPADAPVLTVRVSGRAGGVAISLP